jgi:hypothetical protein
MKKIGLGLIILAGLLAASCASTSIGSIKNGVLVIKDDVTEIPDAKNKTKTNSTGKVSSIGA